MTQKKLKKDKLVEMIDYQEGAIISKTLIDKENGTITLFAFDKGQTISEHTASHEALAQVLDGSVEFTISGEKYELTAGEMIIMPGGEPHSLEAASQVKMLLTMID